METTIEIVGVNGETAVIAGCRAGDKGIYLAPDVGGFFDPDVQVQTETPANLPGGRYVSHRIQIRHITFAVEILNDGSGSGSWRSRDSEWRKMWAYDRPTRIEVTTLDGTRALEAYLEHIEVVMTVDPNGQPINKTIMSVAAYDPFWWAEDDVYEIELGTGSGTITVPDANPTDQEVFPIWVVDAPGTWTLPDYSFTDPALRNRTVPLPTLGAGEHVTVNSMPSERQLTADNGTNVWARMNGRRFRHPIPPYTEEVSFQITREGAGQGKAMLRLKRPFSRPWGML